MKKLLLLAVALLGTYAAQAQTVTVDDVIALEGNSAIQVTLAGSSDVRDMQFSFVVPTGFTLGTITKGDGATDNGAEAFAVATSDGTAVTGGTQYTVVVYSENGDYLVDGVILNIPIEIPANFTGYWNETTHSLSGIAYTVDDATETAVADDTYKFEVGLMGDVDKTGEVDGADAQAMIKKYLNTIGDATFVALVANLDTSSSDIDSGDAQQALKIYLGTASVKAEFDEQPVVLDDDVEWAD